MTNIRKYVYGVREDGSKEFLHTHLDTRGAMNYIKDHKHIFSGRFIKYQIWEGDTLVKDNL